jgi:thiosulfate/3-mercaptopyruvate sulfurtransferase
MLPLILYAALAALPGATPQDAYANPELLVTTAWLAEHATDEGVVVLDARDAGQYADGHVPGALSFPTSETYDPKRNGDIAPPAELAKRFGAHGITAATRVVIYDEGRSTSAARMFWTLEVCGHRNASVVDGGFVKWKAEDRSITTEDATAKPGGFEVAAPNARLSTKDAILEDVGDEGTVMLDSRSSREFNSGRIPEAVHIEWLANFTGDVPVFLAPAELHALYADQGVTPDKRVHAY